MRAQAENGSSSETFTSPLSGVSGSKGRASRRGARLATALFFGASMVLGSATAFAAEPSAEDKAGARAAATAGADAFEQGKWSECIDFFRRAESIIHSPVHELYMARAHVQLGQLVAARELFLKIRRDNKDSESGRKFADSAATDLAAIEPRIAHVTVTVEGAEGREVEITVDGRPFRSVLVGIPQPFDPGAHEFVASAGGGSLEGKATLTLAEAEKQSIAIKLLPTGKAEPTGAPTPTTSARSDSKTDTPATEEGPNWQRIGAYGALGLGAAGVAVGVIFGLSAGDKASQANALCEDETGSVNCQGASNDVQSQVEGLDADHGTAMTLSTIGFIVGGVGIATGVTLLVLDMNDSSAEKDTAHLDLSSDARRAHRSDARLADRKLAPVIAPTYLGLRGSF